MVVLVIVLAIVAAAALVLFVINRSRLNVQRALTSAAEERTSAQAAELATRTADLGTATRERAAADDLAAKLAEAARLAKERAAGADERAQTAAEEARGAEERAVAAEAAAAEYREAAGARGIDPDVLWILEQARSERTWRYSVAPNPDSISVFADTTNPLLAALQVELDAAREEVGTVVELDAEIPDSLTVAATVLTLRAAQELLADVVRRSEETTLRVRADGDDLVVDVISTDEDGEPVLPAALQVPPSTAFGLSPTGVCIHNAFHP